MSYDLNLHFDPAVDSRGFLQYFSQRANYTVSGTEITYQNPATGVGFFIRYQVSKGFLSRKTIGSAQVEINYFRPSYFGMEAEIELAALLAQFAPKIDDPQMKGMGQGPYSREGFLSGWNFGNEFAVRTVLSSQPDYTVQSMAADQLSAAWLWNYKRAEATARVAGRQFIPGVRVLAVQGVPSLVVLWALGMPTLLPKVDYVLVGREVAGARQCGLATWSEVIDVVRRAGIDVGNDPLDIQYPVTPDPIAHWIAKIPEIDLQTVPTVDQVIDTEVLEAARRQMS